MKNKLLFIVDIILLAVVVSLALTLCTLITLFAISIL